MIRINKRTQEEMVGFVLIIVLVAVIGLVFLVISVKKPAEIQGNSEIENFLYSSLMVSTDCRPSSEIVYEFKDLIAACYNEEMCLNGKNSCEVLNETSYNLIEDSWQIGENSPYKAYVFAISIGRENLVYLSRGKQTSVKSGSLINIPKSGENINITMQLFS